MKFTTTIIPAGNATGFEVPREVVDALGGGRPLVVVTLNKHAWRTRVAVMRGQCLVGVSAANREASGVSEGDVIAVELTLDEAPRVVESPPDLAKAWRSAPKGKAAFDQLAFGLQRKHVADIEAAKSAETRAQRIAKLVEAMLAKG